MSRKKFADPLLRPLGNTGLRCHPLGFGCYRVGDGNATHEAALHEYLDRGGNLIDTSANYGDGHSELLVGNASGASGYGRAIRGREIRLDLSRGGATAGRIGF